MKFLIMKHTVEIFTGKQLFVHAVARMQRNIDRLASPRAANLLSHHVSSQCLSMLHTIYIAQTANVFGCPLVQWIKLASSLIP
jgi:hypothetical protein